MRCYSPKKCRLIVFKIVIIYSLIGVTWILGSDQVLDWLIHDRNAMLNLAIFKGSLFVFCTATLLYFLLERFVQQLVSAQKNYQAIFNATNEIIFVHDAQSGGILDVNERMLQVFGYTFDEALTAGIGHLSEGTSPYSQTEAVEMVHKAMSEGPQVFQWLFRKKSGELFWTEVSLRRMAIEKAERVIAVVRDIHERKLVEDDILRAKQDWEQTFDAVPDLISIIDTTHTIRRVNRAMADRFGVAQEELIGLKCHEVIHGTTSLFATCPHARLLQDGNEHSEIVEERRLNAVLDVTVSPIRSSDGVMSGCVHVARDITERKRAEAALEVSEDRWKFALEGTGDGLWDWDAATDRVFYSRQWKALFGYRDDEVGDSPQEWESRLHFEDKAKAIAELERHFRRETEIYSNEHRILCKDGTYKWVLGRGKAIERDTDGKPRRVIGTHTDISDRKVAETYGSMGQEILLILNEKGSLKEAIQHVIGLVKSTSQVDAVGLRLEDEGDFPYFYQEGFPQEFLKTEYSPLARNVDGGICRDEDGNVCLECTCGQVLSGKTDSSSPYATGGGSAWTNDSFPFLEIPPDEDPRTNPRDVCTRQGFASIALIPIRAKGRIVGLLQLNAYRKGAFCQEEIKVLEEIAERIGEALLRKQAEEKLIASERFLLMLTDQLPGMVGYWTNELRCTFANKAFLEWFGKTTEQMMGITIQELMGEELFKKDEPYMRRALQGELQQFERTLIKSSGEIGYTWAHYIPDQVDGSVRGFYVLVSDVTELKKAEEAKDKLESQLQQAQKMESVGRLAGGVAHDFNNLLTVILGCAQLGMLQQDPTHPTHAMLKEIQNAAEKSADLTRQLLGFARKQTIAPKVIDLDEVVENMLKMLRRLIGEDIHLSWQPASHQWWVKIDPSQLDQIMANLCVNARDAIADVGKVTIETGTRVFDAEYCARNPGFIPGEYVLLAVSDNGCGMDKDTMLHIFEPFFTTRALGAGTGLGLATVYGIVKQNNGFITVYSELGQGTTFRIFLPRHAGTETQVLREGAENQLAYGRETILLVEDEPSILNITVTLLSRQGYKVLAANTPSEAINLAEEHAGSINLLMTDVVMPEMNGRDLITKLLPLCPQVKCLFMSGYTADVIAHHGVLDDGVHFISKPFSLPDLAAKVREVLDGN